MRLSAALTDFLLSREGSPRTGDWYDQKLRHFLSWCDTVASVRATEDITPGACQQFLRDMRALPGHLGRGTVSTQTVHGYARALRAFLRYGVRAGWMDPRIPALLTMPKREGRVLPTFSPRQVRQLLLACEAHPDAALVARDSAILLLLLDTGIRASELLTLTLPHTHLHHRDAYVLVHGKGDKWREVGPLGARCQRALIRYVERHRPTAAATDILFLTDAGHPLRLAGLDALLKTLRDTAGISGVRVSAHTFRHTYAVSYLSQPGASIYHLSKLMGHSSVSTTEVYLRDFQQREARRGPSVADQFL